MSKQRRILTREFKIQVVREAESGVSIAELARRYELHPNVIHQWRASYRKNPESAFPRGGRGGAAEDTAAARRVAELEQMVGKQAMEIAFLKKTLTHAERTLGIAAARTGKN